MLEMKGRLEMCEAQVLRTLGPPPRWESSASLGGSMLFWLELQGDHVKLIEKARDDV